MSFIVAVDGPAGSGKGTTTKKMKEELGLINLDTGAMYRCVTLAALRKGYTADNEDEIVNLVNSIDIQIINNGHLDTVLLNGEDVSKEIRSKEVSQNVYSISSIALVREKLVELQRNLAEGKNIIAEGRDVGTVVFPNADVKIYLDADEKIRAQRRYKENLEKGINTSYEEVLENIRARDEADKTKKVGALKKADDAVIVDTSNKTIEEVANEVKKIILSKMSK